MTDLSRLDERGARVRAVTWAQTDGRLAAMISRETGVHVATVYGSRSQIEHRVRSAVMYWTGRAPAAVAWFEVRSLDGDLGRGALDGETIPVRVVDAQPSREALIDHLLWLAARVEAEGPSACEITLRTDPHGAIATEVQVQW